MSLRSKLLLIIAPVFFVLWLIASYFSITQLQNEINQAMDSRLQSTARMVNNLALSNPQVGARPGLDASKMFSDSGSAKGLACKISSLSGEVIANSHPGELTLPPTATSGFTSFMVGDTQWRSYTLNTPEHNIAIAEKLSERRSIFLSMVLVSALPTLIAIIVSFVIIWFAIGRELKPLQRLKKAITNRSPDDLKPIQLEHKLIELSPLIDSQNALFEKLEGVIEREKTFTANAAHELRTPLTGIISQLQVAKITDGDPRSNAIRQSLTSALRLQSLVENLLLLARVENDGARGRVQPWNLHHELDSVFKQFGFARSNIDIQLECAAVITQIPTFAFSIIIKNLVENARHHGQTGAPISLMIKETTDAFKIEVQNVALLADETLEKMSQRFWRDSAARGTGLGLAIVNALVKELGGSIDYVYDKKSLSVCIKFSLKSETL